jgi:transcription termination factor NusB
MKNMTRSKAMNEILEEMRAEEEEDELESEQSQDEFMNAFVEQVEKMNEILGPEIN